MSLEPATDRQRAVDAILMKTVSPVRSAERSTIVPNQLGVSRLSGTTTEGEDRVAVAIAGDDFPFVDWRGGVQGDRKHMPRRKVLQQIHVVSDRRPVTLGGWKMVIPTGPGSALAGEQGFIGVKHRLVDLVWNGRQNFSFEIGRIGTENLERLIGVACKYDFVEDMNGTASLANVHTRGTSGDALDRATQPDPGPKTCRQFLDVSMRTASNDTPDRAVAETEQTVMLVKLDDEPNGEIFETRSGAGPDR